MNRSVSIIAYGNASIMAMITTVLVLLPLHGIIVIGQLIAAACGITATALHAVAAHRIERAESAANR